MARCTLVDRNPRRLPAVPSDRILPETQGQHTRWSLIMRRRLLAGAAALAACPRWPAAHAQPADRDPELRWYEAAAEMMRLAQSWGDQPYGAVLVLHGTLVGQGPSRVVKNQDPDAHAEREAIRDAQERLGRLRLPGSLLYSTSRPCLLCEAAAAQAGVDRMYFGALLSDAGVPGRPR